MSVDAVLAAAQVARLTITAVGDQLSSRGPRGALTPALRAQLVEHREELVARLHATPGGSRPAAGGAGDAPVVASGIQQRLWLACQLEADTTSYHEPLLARLDGDLDVARLDGAFRSVLAAHDALRTVLRVVDNVPHQFVLDPPSSVLDVVDLSGTPIDERDAAALGLTRQLVAAPFDLATDLPLRATVLRLGPTTHELVIVRHHVAADGWSVPVLLRDLAAAYLAPDGDLQPADGPRVRSRDVAHWEHLVRKAGGFERDAAFWLAEARRARALGLVDRVAPAVEAVDPTAIARRHDLTIDPDLVGDIRAVAARHRTTPFAVVAAALALAVARARHETAVAIGASVANRRLREIEDVVGCFADVVPLTLGIQWDASFTDLLDDVARRSAAVLDHHPPSVAGRPAGLPRPDVVLAFQNIPVDDVDLGGVRARLGDTPPVAPKFPLLVTVAEEQTSEGPAWRSRFEHSADVDEAAVADVAATLVHVLRGAVQRLGAPCRELLWRPVAPMVPPAVGDEPQLAAERLRQTVAAGPDCIAVVDGDHQLTYGSLMARAKGRARDLERSGASASTPVIVREEPSIELVVQELAVLLVGGAFVPVDVADSSRRAASIGEKVAAWRTEEPSASTRPTHPDDLAYVIHTSGSTGTPKGVMVSQRSLAELVGLVPDAIGCRPGDRWSWFHSPAFDVSVFEIWACLATGGRLVVVPPPVVRSPLHAARLLAEQQVDVLSQTPTAFTQLGSLALDAIDEPPRLVVLAGERCDPVLVRPWLDRFGSRSAVLNLYGITEVTVHATLHRLTAADARGTSSPIGTWLPGRHGRVIDCTGGDAGPGVIGELAVGGGCLARGYLGRPRLTAERFRPAAGGPAGTREYRSGDLVVRDDQGFLRYRGRTDDQLKIRGFRVEPAEVRAALLTLEDVADAVVGPHETGDRVVLAAWIVPAPAATVDPISLRRSLAAVLPDHLVPSVWGTVARIPRTQSGKVDRCALPVPDAQRTRSRAPATPLERSIAALWSEVLELEGFGVDDTFYELGGDSLLLARCSARLPSAVGVELPIATVFAEPTVARLAAAVAAVETTDDDLVDLLDEIEALSDDEVARWLA